MKDKVNDPMKDSRSNPMPITHTLPRRQIMALCALALPLLLISLAGGRTAHAQDATLNPGAAQALRLGTGQPSPAAPAPKATVRDPDRLRVQLRAYHGFTREGLEAASTDVPALLMAMATDDGEPMSTRRQAVKALALFEEQTVLQFMIGQTEGAPLGLRRVYANSLARFSEAGGERLLPVLAFLLDDADLVVRMSAARLGERLSALPEARRLLNARLAREAQPDVQSALRQALDQ